MDTIYFDHAATTPLYDEVIQEMLHVMKEYYGNPSSLHSKGRKSKVLIEKSRRTIANHLNASPLEIVFTNGGTEGNNLVLRSVVKNNGVKRIITSYIEHSSVIKTVEDLRKNGVEVDYVNLDPKGVIRLDHLEQLLQKDIKTCISIMHANNEVGNINDIYAIGKLCAQYGACFHSDTIQTMGKLHLDMKDFPADFAVCSAHKIHGPKGIGFLWIRDGFKIHSVITGGGQEKGARPGTENLYGIVGLGKAFEIKCKNMDKDMKYVSSLKSYCIEQIKREIPKIKFNGLSGDIDRSLPYLINLSLPVKNSMISFILDMKHIAISGASACTSGASKESHVIEHVGNPNATVIRMSFDEKNTKKEIDTFIRELKTALDGVCHLSE